MTFPHSANFVAKHFIIATSANILIHPVEYLKGVGPQRADLIKKELGIFTFNDLLHHFPYRHLDRTRFFPVSELTPGIEFGQVKGVLIHFEVIGERSGKRLVA